MNEQERWWYGDGGNAYTKRNRVDWRLRIPFWQSILERTGARSVYEFGCNAGWNLSAIKRAFPDVATYGVDINMEALRRAARAGLKVDDELCFGACELSFTAGVLIHIAPENLHAIMQSVVDKSTDYVLAVEYASPTEEMIKYRDQNNLLWKRNYGALYMDMGLELVEMGPAGKGFDNCTAWLLRKP